MPTFGSALRFLHMAKPGTAPASGSVLLYFKSDGKLYKQDSAGTETSIENVPAASNLIPQVQVFSIAGGATWTKPANTIYAVVELVGGGGAGGSCANSVASQSSAAGGGGGGGYSKKAILNASLGATETVTVGAAGVPAGNGNNDGGAGGQSSFGAHCSGNGGNGGSGSASTGAGGGVGGTGGTAANGDLNIPGGPGGAGRVQGGLPVQTSWGGDTPLGYGGRGMATNVGNAGQAGTGYGSGGGGAFSKDTVGSANGGGAGTAGVVIVTAYVST